MDRRAHHIFFLFTCFFKCFPTRLKRFVVHPFIGFQQTRGSWLLDYIFWVIEWPLLLIDLLGAPEFLEMIQVVCKRNIRLLTSDELHLGREMLGSKINWHRIKMDNRAYIGPKQGRFAYVFHYTINYWGTIYPATYVHELIHIWQFEHFGSVYLLRALRAQHSKEKYDYGGIDNLKSHLDRGLTFSQLNYEQQGDVLSDYYLLKTGALRGRGRGQLEEMEVYEKLLAEVWA